RRHRPRPRPDLGRPPARSRHRAGRPSPGGPPAGRRRSGRATAGLAPSAPPRGDGSGLEHLKIHPVPIPVLGGLGVVAAVLGALLAAGADLPALAVAGVVMATGIG